MSSGSIASRSGFGVRNCFGVGIIIESLSLGIRQLEPDLQIVRVGELLHFLLFAVQHQFVFAYGLSLRGRNLKEIVNKLTC